MQHRLDATDWLEVSGGSARSGARVLRPGLFWSRSGEIAYATRPGSARWEAERWIAVRAGARRLSGFEYQCQHCSPSGSPIVHHGSFGVVR